MTLKPGWYIKSTQPDGKSFNTSEPVITYKLGMVVHPSPDRKSDSECGVGIHLGKSVAVARYYAHSSDASYWLVRAGVILGEGSDKVRCASCLVVKKLTKTDLLKLEYPDWATRLESQENQALIKLVGYDLFKTGGLCGRSWLLKHWSDVTKRDIENQSLKIHAGRNTMRLKATQTRRNIKVALGVLRGV